MSDDPFKIRRQWAKNSFRIIVGTLAMCIVIGLFCDAAQVDNLVKLGFIITPILLCLTGLIVQYSQLVHFTDKDDKDRNKEKE